jgi:CubicO group peptidase (beta-lactamase class C family)
MSVCVLASHITSAQNMHIQKVIDDYVAAEMAKAKTPGVALAVIKDGKPLLVKGYGLANVELNVPVKPETIFQSGSIGKQFTAAAVMLLVEDGKIGLDQKIARYVGEVPDAWQNITVRNLLNHTAGLTDDFPDEDYQKDWTEDELLAKAKTMPLVFTPGTSWAYSNVGYVVLGIMVGKVTGKHYGDFLRERIFNPLGMTTTRIISESDIILNRAAGYRLVNGELKNQEWVSPTMNTTADGSLYWSILDLVKWDEALTKGLVLKPESWVQVYTPAKLASGSAYPYGFGWGIETVNGHRVIEHNGQWQGFVTNISRYVDDKLTVIALTNLSSSPATKISHSIAEIIEPALIERAVRDEQPVLTAVHRKLLESIADGIINKDLFTEQAQKVFIPRIESGRDGFRSLGAIESFALLKRISEGDEFHHRYAVKFKNGTAFYDIRTGTNGKITAMRFQIQ